MTQTPDAERVWLYKSFFFLPLRLAAGSFKSIPASKRASLSGAWFQTASPEIQIGRPDTYAEYVYFHPHARKLLFVPQNQKAADRSGSLDALYVYNLKDDCKKNLYVEIGLPRRMDREESERFVRLRVEDVAVMLYDVDVAILSIEVVWDSRKVAQQGNQTLLTMADAFDVTNLLRRRGPSFVDIGEAEMFRGNADHRPDEGWGASQKGIGELPNFVRFGFLDEKGNFTNVPSADGQGASEDFGARFDCFVMGNQSDSPQDGYIGRHFQFWIDRFVADIRCPDLKVEGPIFDERGFYWSYTYLHESITGFTPLGATMSSNPREPQNPFGELTGESQAYREFLYRLVFADPAKNTYHENSLIRDHLLESSLYLRYRDLGTVYGFCRYGGVMLVQGTSDENWFARTKLRRDFETMYFQMANLLVTLRAGLLRFSERSAEITQKIHDRGVDHPELAREIEDLRQDFLLFHNKYWFCEITSQEQGIEMFDLWNRNMSNVRLFEEVDAEIKALHEFSLSKINTRLGQIAYLNISAVAVAVVAAILAGLSLSLYPDGDKRLLVWGIGSGVAASVFAYFGFLCGTRILNWLDVKKKKCVDFVADNRPQS
ncbi:MAG: hypothetical protein IT350_05320 [Deltaproteobacteria bacterium]|nr:hypothetical protein [Deltaproteobacteria bacterium]